VLPEKAEWWKRPRRWFVGRRRRVEASAQLLLTVFVYCFVVFARSNYGGNKFDHYGLTSRYVYLIWSLDRQSVDLVDTASMGLVFCQYPSRPSYRSS
jgi:hypothetical protein